jgi:hypothetical protein
MSIHLTNRQLLHFYGRNEIEGPRIGPSEKLLKLLRQFEDEFLSARFTRRELTEYDFSGLVNEWYQKYGEFVNPSFWFKAAFFCDDEIEMRVCVVRGIYCERHKDDATDNYVAELLDITVDESKRLRSLCAKRWLGRFKNGSLPLGVRVS